VTNDSNWSTEDAPYWRRHYGIGRAWQPRAGARRGCVIALLGVLLLIVLVLVVAFVIAAMA
jgi:hypothetical protein